MEQPSKDWTAEERLKVIFELSAGLRVKIRDAPGSVALGEVFDVADRIALVSNSPAYYLEGSREEILKGLL